MKHSSPQQRIVSLVILIAFVALLHGGPLPAQAPVGADDSTAGVARGDDDAPGSFEAESAAPAALAKKKKFPWLIVALGAVAIGVTVLLLVGKKSKQVTLTVILDSGAEGTPALTARYPKGEAVPYSYAPRQGHGGLKVTIDGVVVPASGRIAMDKDHALMVTTSLSPTLLVNTQPSGAKIFMDGSDTGFVTPHTFVYAVAATPYVVLRHGCGYQEWAQAVSVEPGRETVLYPALRPGIAEGFDIPLSPCWQPRDPSAWTVASGVLAVKGARKGYELALYSQALPTDFVITVKQKIDQSTRNGTIGVIFATNRDMANSAGYEFAFTANKKYVIYKNKDYDHYVDKGPWTFIQYNAPCLPMNTASGAWNTIRIIKAGANYSLYVNDRFVYSFADDDHDVRYVALGIFDHLMKVGYDSVELAPGDVAGSVPGLPASEIPAATNGRGNER